MCGGLIGAAKKNVGENTIAGKAMNEAEDAPLVRETEEQLKRRKTQALGLLGDSGSPLGQVMERKL